MDRFKRSSIFWVLLLVTAFSPALLAVKQVHQAKMRTPNGAGNGASMISVNTNASSTYTYIARTTQSPGGSIVSAYLIPVGGAWSIPLCETGGPADDDCTYDATGNLFIEGALTPSQLIGAGVTGAQFNAALNGGTLTVVLSDGTTGTFVQII